MKDYYLAFYDVQFEEMRLMFGDYEKELDDTPARSFEWNIQGLSHLDVYIMWIETARLLIECHQKDIEECHSFFKCFHDREGFKKEF